MSSVKLSITQLSHGFGLARETVKRRLTGAKVKPIGKLKGHPVYELRDAVQALQHDDPEKLDPFRRKAALQSEQISMRIATDRGELVPIDDVRETFAAAFKPIRQTLEVLPDLLERDAAMTPQQVTTCERAIDKLRETLHEQLNGLADVR